MEAAFLAFANVYSSGQPSQKRRKMSAKSRAKIAAAQRARWAKFRKSKQKQSEPKYNSGATLRIFLHESTVFTRYLFEEDQY